MEWCLRFIRRIVFYQKRSSLLTNWKTFVFFDLMTPILRMLCYSAVIYYVYGSLEGYSWMIGNVLLISSFGALYEVSVQLFVEKNNGTLGLLMASKTSLQENFLTNAIAAMFTGLISVILGFVILSIIFQIQWTASILIPLSLVTVISVFVSMSFGYLFAPFILVTNEINLLLNIVSGILVIFSGANFSLNKLPLLLQYFSNILPLTRSIKVAHGIISGHNISMYYPILLQEVLMGVIYFIIGSFLIKKLEIVSRRKGRLDFI